MIITTFIKHRAGKPWKYALGISHRCFCVSMFSYSFYSIFFFEETLGQDYKFPPFFSFVCLCARVCTFMCRCVFLYVFVSICVVGQRSKSTVFFSLSTLYFEIVSHSQSLTIQLDRVTRDPRGLLLFPSNTPAPTGAIDARSPAWSFYVVPRLWTHIFLLTW